MRVKALVDFGGQYAMAKGFEQDLPDNPVTRSLINGGFIKVVGERAAAPAKSKEKPEPTPADLSELTKAELLTMCAEKGIEVSKKAKKDDLIAALEA